MILNKNYICSNEDIYYIFYFYQFNNKLGSINSPELMKILYDFEIFTKQSFGGVSRYFYEIISRLEKQKNFDISVFLGINCSGYRFDALSDIINITQKKINYPQNLHLLLYYFNKLWFNRAIKSNNFDILHKTYYSDVGLGGKYKIISTIHDMTHEIYPGYFVKGDGTTELKKKCAKESNALICVSETTKNDLVNIFNIDPSIIKVIYHGITIKNNDSVKKIIDKPFILYVGQRWGYKNFNTLLSAYSYENNLNDNYILICFGGGEFNLSEKLFLKKNKLEDKVIHLSGNDDLLISLYKFADLLVYTSYYEGFGFPPLEAMECECPVLTSPGGSVKEVLGDSAVYFDPASAEDLLIKMNTLINDRELREKMILSGKERVKQFTWEKSVYEHFKYYNEILNN